MRNDSDEIQVNNSLDNMLSTKMQCRNVTLKQAW